MPVSPLPLRIIPLAMSASGCHRTASDGFPETFSGFSLLSLTSDMLFVLQRFSSLWLHYYTIIFVCQHFFNNFVKNFLFLKNYLFGPEIKQLRRYFYCGYAPV